MRKTDYSHYHTIPCHKHFRCCQVGWSRGHTTWGTAGHWGSVWVIWFAGVMWHHRWKAGCKKSLQEITKKVLFFVILLGGMLPSPFFLYPNVFSSFLQPLSSHRRSLNGSLSALFLWEVLDSSPILELTGWPGMWEGLWQTECTGWENWAFKGGISPDNSFSS